LEYSPFYQLSRPTIKSLHFGKGEKEVSLNSGRQKAIVDHARSIKRDIGFKQFIDPFLHNLVIDLGLVTIELRPVK
jgi:hypothetical protein